MPGYGIPGVAVGPRAARRTGVALTTVAAVLTAGWFTMPRNGDGHTLSVTLLTEHIGTGVETGNDVRVDGIRIGTIAHIEPAGQGRQRISLALDRAQSGGLTDALSVDYAPGNLFGVSEIELRAGVGGTALADGSVVDLTGPAATRATDATISTLLGATGRLATEVLTPQLISVLNTIARDTRMFTPILQALVVSVQSIADTQRLPSSYLLQQYGQTLQGLPLTIDGLLRLLNAPFTNEYFQQDAHIGKFNAGIGLLKDDIINALNAVLTTSRTHLAEYPGLFGPLLHAVAGTVPDPQRSGAELTQLLQRLGSAMPDTPDGPVLRVQVDVGAFPVLAAMPAITPPGGER